MRGLLVLIVTAWISRVTSQTLDPGCSFFNGQCVYNVKLGHSSQCDSVSSRATTDTSATGSGSGSTTGFQSCSCKDIDALNNDVATLNTNMNTLQSNFNKLAQTLNTTQQQLSGMETQYSVLMMEKQNLTADLTHHQLLLTKSQVELANMVSSMTIETDRLRTELLSTSDKLTICQTQLNLLDSQTTNTPVLYGDYVSHYCGFEDLHNCNYTLDTCTSSEVECWHRGTGKQDVYSGPVEDHTYGSPNGHYMYIDPTLKPFHASSSPSPDVTPRKARMTSPELPAANEYCVRFWYTMNGANIGTLNVYAQVGGGDGYPVYTMTGNEDEYWHMAQISLDSEYTAQPIRIVFEGTTSSYYTLTPLYPYPSRQDNYDTLGFISFDDVYIYNTSCSAIPDCPAGSRKLVQGNVTSCYSFHITPRSWYEAVDECKSEASNGHLVGINSELEQQFLVDAMQTNAAYTTAGQHGWYTSGNDERTEASFMWTDTGYPYSLNYTDWHAGQPNNVGNAQDCLLLQYQSSDYEWGDVDCADKHPFICEMHV
ncbi:MAM and LDL-receptor class A domain-containing protein 1-like [Mya arenaria]|uniref:MAM and LDL-receptor class A domain-containing protein 1-like n=1 Tax=Mya arenaria TaxID=6604 RepID=UPI0022DF710C|nr:MAM and LDL-receptor class A domain-containing protein 1-like [Mya arenaria]